MLNFIIPLIESYFSSGLAVYYLFPMIALGFLYCMPAIIKSFCSWR